MFELKTNEDLKDYYRRYKYLLEIKHEVDPYIPNNSGIDSFNRNDYGWPVQFQFSILRDVISETVRILYGNNSVLRRVISEKIGGAHIDKRLQELAYELESNIILHPTAFHEFIKKNLEEMAREEKIGREELELKQRELDGQRAQQSGIGLKLS